MIFDDLVASCVPPSLLADVKYILVTIGLVNTLASQAWDTGWLVVVVVVVVVSSSVVHIQNWNLPTT